MKYKILIADDHEMVREGVKSLISQNANLELVGEAGTASEAVTSYHATRPDLLILDVSLPDKNGMEVAKEILDKSPLANIIMFSMYNDEDYITRCMEYGVKGFVIKNESGRELQSAINAVLGGNTYFSRQVQNVIFNRFTSSTRKKEVAQLVLTKREVEIIKLLSDGLTSQQIADKLFISSRTVETHRANVMKKLNAKNAVELVKKSRDLKLI